MKSPSVSSRFQWFAVIAALLVMSVPGVRGASGRHRAALSTDLLAHEARHSTTRARVIVRGTGDQVTAIAARHHLTIVRMLEDGAVLAASSAELTDLAADGDVPQVSGDARVRLMMSVSRQSTGADQVQAGVSGFLGIGSVAPATGAGIGVAVIDSGISSHAALANKVVANVSFVTGDADTRDTFGHGTHVAGIIAGTASAALGVTNLYTGGIAPGAQLINVRVLGDDGSGLTSDVIAGMDWAIANRQRYNIRIINLSLGHPVFESSTTDPLCVEVAKAVNAGIVVVTSAGNTGKTADGTPILGGISSPGNSPYALTVGALNTFGTAKRSDDGVTTYSSRGPTRFDLAVKPDVAAPGNKIVSLEAAGSYLPANYSFLHRAGSGTNAYMQLSGTSMAAPMVSGGVALLLQGSSSLSPAQVKLAMQTSSTYVNDGGLMGAGAGSVNFWAARKTASTGLLGSLLNTVVGGLTTASSGASFWDAGTLGTRLYGGLGIRLLSLLQAPLAWLNPSLLHYGDLNLVGLLNPLASMAPVRLQYGIVSSWTSDQQIIWGDAIYNPQGQQIIWGDSNTTDDNQIIWGDAVLTSADPK